MLYQEKRVRQVNLMIVENLESGEFSAFLTNDPMNIKTSKDLQEVIINLILSTQYLNRENKSSFS